MANMMKYDNKIPRQFSPANIVLHLPQLYIKEEEIQKDNNIEVVKRELQACAVSFDDNLGWRKLQQLLKDNKRQTNPDSDAQYSKPVTEYKNSKWDGA
eukprot:13276166-Ditylum_brightwellii.AAC.1